MRPLPHYSQMTPAEGQAMERAYANRQDAVREKTKEIAIKPVELLYIMDDRDIAERMADLMKAFYHDGDLLEEARMLCKSIDYKARQVADREVPEVDEEDVENER